MATPNVTNHTHGFYLDSNADPDACTIIGSVDSITESHALDSNLMVRIGNQNDSAAAVNDPSQLQYRVGTGGTWTDVNATSSNVRSSAGTPTDGAACDTQILTSGTGTFDISGNYDEVDGLTPASAIAKSSFWEDQWCVQLRSAELSGGETIFFRAVVTDASMTYPADPGGLAQITVAAGITEETGTPSDGLVFDDGVPAGQPDTPVSLADGALLDDGAPAAKVGVIEDAVSDGVVFDESGTVTTYEIWSGGGLVFDDGTPIVNFPVGLTSASVWDDGAPAVETAAGVTPTDGMILDDGTPVGLGAVLAAITSGIIFDDGTPIGLAAVLEAITSGIILDDGEPVGEEQGITEATGTPTDGLILDDGEPGESVGLQGTKTDGIRWGGTAYPLGDLVEELVDRFNGVSVDTDIWEVYEGGSADVSEGAGFLKLDLPITDQVGDGEVFSKEGFSLVGTSLYARIDFTNVPDNDYTFAQFGSSTHFTPSGLPVGWKYKNGNLYATYKLGGGGSEGTPIAYNSTTHAWFRIRESGGTVYWDTAPDNEGEPGSWTNRKSLAASSINQLFFNRVALVIYRGSVGDYGSGYVLIDTLNAVDAVAVSVQDGVILDDGTPVGQPDTPVSLASALVLDDGTPAGQSDTLVALTSALVLDDGTPAVGTAAGVALASGVILDDGEPVGETSGITEETGTPTDGLVFDESGVVTTYELWPGDGWEFGDTSVGIGAGASGSPTDGMGFGEAMSTGVETEFDDQGILFSDGVPVGLGSALSLLTSALTFDDGVPDGKSAVIELLTQGISLSDTPAGQSDTFKNVVGSIVFDDGTPVVLGSALGLLTSALTFDDGTPIGLGSVLGLLTSALTFDDEAVAGVYGLAADGIVLDDGTPTVFGAALGLLTSALTFDDGTPVAGAFGPVEDGAVFDDGTPDASVNVLGLLTSALLFSEGVVPLVFDAMLQAWAFVLDGHIFYVLNSVNGDTIVCDLRTGQWHHWYTGSESTWNMSRGRMWQGRIIACDESKGTIWEVDPESVLDEETTEISRVVTGFQPIRGRASVRQGSLRVTASMGEPSATPATVRMRWSDDEGDTWSSWKSITLNDEEYTQVLRYRGLGRMRAPGRIWEVADEGGLIRIEGIDSDIG